MKPLIFAATAVAILVTTTQQGFASPAQQYNQVDEWEYKILKENCLTIILWVESRLAGQGALNSSATPQICKREISNYLLSRGTPAARKIYAEYEAVGWKYPDIKNIR